MRPNERRRKILELMNLRRNDTMQHLAEEFGVLRMTIYRDFLVLAEEYPFIHTFGRGEAFLCQMDITYAGGI